MDHIKDENGAYINCIGYPKLGRYECGILKDWYNVPARGNRCGGCPFFKTRAQADADAEKYPPQEEYKEKKRGDRI